MSILADLYPVLYALYPVLALLAANLGEIPISAAGRSLAAAAGAGLMLVLLLSLLARDLRKGGLLAVGYIVLFASYGHVYDQVEGVSVGPVLVGRHRYLLALWAAVAVGWTVWVLTRRRASAGLRRALQVAGLTLVVFPLMTMGRYYGASVGASQNLAPQGIAEGVSSSDSRSEYPDIFYIILDGYGRSDVLRELYEVDNTAFIEFLKSRGFYVADESTSNYSQTLLSLASSLNMQYLDDLAEKEGPASGNLAPLDEMIAHSTVRQVLGQLGYQFVAFETGYPHIEIRDADLFLAPRYDTYHEHPSVASALRLNEFEGLLIDTTLVKAIAEYYESAQEVVRALNDFTYLKHRARVTFTLDSLGDIAAMPGHYFVYAHVVSPHPPFVFGKFGQEIPHSGPYGLDDRGCCSPAEYIEGYAAQLAYISSLVEQAVADILANAETRPIIILQGDHGPGAYINLEAPLQSNMCDRLSILNAYLVPEEAREAVYPSITPVNTFRLILATVFGADLALLEDESYFAPGGHPYALVRVTDRVRACP